MWVKEAELDVGHPNISCWIEDAKDQYESELILAEKAAVADESTTEDEPTKVSLDLDDEKEVNLHEQTQQIREQIKMLGPFAWREYKDIDAGVKYKQYQILRTRKGSKLGPKERLEYHRFEDLTEGEKVRVKRYMYDQDLETFATECTSKHGMQGLLAEVHPSVWEYFREGVTDNCQGSSLG